MSDASDLKYLHEEFPCTECHFTAWVMHQVSSGPDHQFDPVPAWDLYEKALQGLDVTDQLKYVLQSTF